MTRRLYGARSERHHPGQQRIELGQTVEMMDDGDAAEVPASVAADATMAATMAATTTPTATTSAADLSATPSAAAPATPVRRPRTPGSHPGRHRLPVGAEIVEEDLTVPEQERLDADGMPLPVIGWRTSDKWDYRPGVYVVRRFRRAIYGRPFSDAQDRIVADMPAMLIPRGAMTDAALIHTVIDKFADHLPLYRQQARAGRSGFPLSRATLVGHVAAVAEAMTPIVAVLSEQVRQSRYLHLDETPVRMLDPGRGHAATTRIWVYRSPAATVFRFSTTREGRHPAEFLGDYRGHIVADGYAGHERLYRVEEDARLVSDDDRHRLRQERSRGIINRIGERLDAAVRDRLPAADLGIAIDYTRKRWRQLCRFLDHGWLPIDNNPAENALRPWAIGRKNWLFFGSPAGGQRAATIATIIENCRSQDLDPYRYLCDTVAALHTGRTDYAALTPQAVAARIDTGVA
jgi:transposase